MKDNANLGLRETECFYNMRLIVESTEGTYAEQPLSYSQTEIATTWYHQHTAAMPNTLVFSDLNLYGKLLVKGASYQDSALTPPSLTTISPSVYDWLVGKEPIATEYPDAYLLHPCYSARQIKPLAPG